MKQAGINRSLESHYVTPNTFGRALRRLRVTRGLTRDSLATMSGVQARRLTDLETNQAPPSYHDIKNLAAALRASEEDLLVAAGYIRRRQEA